MGQKVLRQILARFVIADEATDIKCVYPIFLGVNEFLNSRVKVNKSNLVNINYY